MTQPRREASTSQEPAAKAASIVVRLAELGARYDAAPLFPAESIRCLASAGLHRDFAPAAGGGTGFIDTSARYFALMDVLRIVGRADLSLGRLYEGHVNALALFEWYASPAQMARLKRELENGAFYGVWVTEPSPGVTISIDGKGRHVLNGGKSFASGAGGLACALVTAQPPAGERRLVIVPANDESRVDMSPWRVRGMRATNSGHYDLTGLRVEENDLLGLPGDYDRDPRFTAGAWRFIAVQLGGIEALLAETRSAMSTAARGDPVQRARFADCIAAARTAYLWVRESARRAARCDTSGGEDHDMDAATFVRMARGIVERAALDVLELSARIVGTRSAMDGERIDKISRDLSLYLRQAGPDYARDEAARAWLDRDVWGDGDALW